MEMGFATEERGRSRHANSFHSIETPAALYH
jgi:hypothetical protein